MKFRNKIWITVLFVLCIKLSTAQIFLTSNDEQCIIVKQITDPIQNNYVVVILGDSIENIRIFQLLKKNQEDAITNLIQEGYRVEIFRANELTVFKPEIKTKIKNNGSKPKLRPTTKTKGEIKQDFLQQLDNWKNAIRLKTGF